MRILRIVLAGLSVTAMTLLLSLPTVAVFNCLGWLPRLQLLPAIMAGEVLALVVIAVSVALAGRLYCSVVCPLGIVQDLSGWLLSLVRLRRRKPIRISRSARYGAFAVFACLVALGLTGLIAPYGIFGRFVTVGVMHAGDPSVALVVWAVALFAFIVGMTAFCGRWWCNQICPVGTFLGMFSRFAVFRPRIDCDKCVKCGLCAKACDKGAIKATPGKSVAVDQSMCVSCFKCKGSCRKGALKWR